MVIAEHWAMRPLDKSTLQERLRDSLLGNYQALSDTLKGAALGVGALATLRVFEEMDVLLFSMWLAGLSQVIVTHASWRRGVLMTVDRTTSWDVLIPMSVGTIEIIYFAMLGTWAIDKLVSFLPAAILAHGVLASALIWNRIASTHPLDYAKDIRSLGIQYIKWMKRDRIMATLVSATTAGVVWVLAYYEMEPWLLSVGFFGFSAVLVRPIVQFQRERMEVSRHAWK